MNFSLLDFVLITGLQCHSNIDSASFVHGIERGRLRSEYFVAKKNIKREDIKDTWRNNLKGKPNRRSSNDEMTVQRTSLENAFTMEVGLQSPRNVILKDIPQNFKSYKINGCPKPRMVTWSSVDSYSFKDLQMKVFNDGVENQKTNEKQFEPVDDEVLPFKSLVIVSKVMDSSLKEHLTAVAKVVDWSSKEQ
ncbi:hypothetical protein TIFTF001_017210 [Ficus carica]|uniref:Uncharacterized protein n=1 Tax=Ficus carica TaxID=3494 RepID=A0AA88AQD3_FICCA|nr:hypothetical protein TIFTF001_017210 [Ficus carica]